MYYKNVLKPQTEGELYILSIYGDNGLMWMMYRTKYTVDRKLTTT